MATISMFAVHDKAVEAYMQPFYARSKGEAVRSFMDACNDPKHQFNGHASDYVLFYIGEFEDASGLLLQNDKVHPERIISASECLAMVER